MAIEYSFAGSKDTLIVTASGCDENAREVQDYGMAVIAAARECGCQRVLCDERDLVYQTSALDAVQVLTALAAGAPDIERVAFISSVEGADDAFFHGIAASNRGVEAQAFVDPEMARKWIARPLSKVGSPYGR